MTTLVLAAAETAKFMANVSPEPNSGCWLWTGQYYSYGRFDVKRDGKWRSFWAHRLAWQIAKGTDPGRMFVCHRCNNKACVNPDHLYLATTRENTQDAARDGLMQSGQRHYMRRGGAERVRGTKNPAARLSESDVREILASTETHDAIAKRFGVHRAYVSLVKSGKRWRWLQRERA